MPMRPKRRVALSKEASWRARVNTWPNMSTRRTDSSSDSTSNGDVSDGPSREASEADGWHPIPWMEDEVKPNQEELSVTLIAGTRSPPKEEGRTTVVFQSKVGKAAVCLSSDSAGKAGISMQGLQDGPVGSATSSGDTNNTGCEKSARKSFHCTACGNRLFSLWEIRKHPDLGVGICRACYNFLFSSPYTKDKSDCSEEQCRWCGEGGRIVMCDQCDKSFCESCIVRNYGPKDLALVVSNNWSCFCCDPELLRVPIDEFKEFRTSLLQTEKKNFPTKRKGASWAGQLIPRDAREDILLGTVGEGATIAELLVQEEERRNQNKGMWTNSARVKFTAHQASRKKKKVTNPELHTKVRHPATTGVKQEHEPAIDKQAPASTTPARTWIRPHQWVEKRQEAAERRKRVEAERLKNVTNQPNDGPIDTNSNTSEHPPHNMHCNKEGAYQKLPSEIAHSEVKSVGLSDAVLCNEGEVKEMA